MRKIKIETLLIITYIVFWSFWLSLNHIVGNLLSLKVEVLVMGSLFFFLMGWLCLEPLSVAKKAYYYKNSDLSSQRLLIIAYLVIALNVFFAYEPLKAIIDYGWAYRVMMYESDEIASQFLRSQILQPLNYAVITVSVVTPGLKNSLSFVALICLMDAVLTLGRFPIYHFMYFLCVISFVNSKVKRTASVIGFRLIATVPIILAVSIWLLIGKLISEDNLVVGSLSDIIRLFLVNYHFIGFHMIDHLLDLEASGVLEVPNLKVGLGFLDWFIYQLIKVLGVPIVYDNSYMNIKSIFNAGIYLKGLDYTYNAFSSNLMPLYVAGGSVGVVVGHFMFGLMAKLSCRKTGFAVNPYFLSLMFCMTFGIFQPMFFNYILQLWVLIFLIFFAMKIRN